MYQLKMIFGISELISLFVLSVKLMFAIGHQVKQVEGLLMALTGQ